tara:strand:+ start:2179 stop:3333 length:1155 start_codon:yes stop_codon:yes gene_type:complete
MSWSDLIDVGMGVANLASTISTGREASRLNDMTESQIVADIARQNEVADLYSEGSSVMGSNLNNLLKEYGDFGQVTPSLVNDFQKFVSSNRSAEEAANASSVDGLTAYDKARLSGMEDMFREYAGKTLDTGQEEVYYRDQYGRATSPRTTDFAAMQDQIASKFREMRNENTQKSLDVQYSRALANIPEGMENSTLRVQMERANGDAAREAYNNDMLASVGDAQQYIAGLQTAASNQQNMTNAERNMQRNLVKDGLDYSTTTLSNNLKGGQYGQDLYTNENSMRGRNIDELKSLKSMRNNTALMDYTSGLNLVGAENALANDFLSQTMNLSTAPTKYAADGANSISNSNSISALGTMAANQQTLANQAGAGLGGWWSNYKSANNF